MSDKQNQPTPAPPVSVFTGPIGELIAQRMLTPPPRPGVLAAVDGYEILRVLGGGGMGIVLLARTSQGGREVAIKLVKSDLVADQNVIRRFLKEAGHLKKLRHTNIVPVDEISDRAAGPYFVMPFFEKGSLANRIKPNQPMNTEAILEIATQVAEGLSFAHRSGIIHRDLKPANILLGPNGTVCLADFGLARTMFNDTVVDVESRQMEGTAPYMSPAVAAGDAEDTRCDIYSFGALLYEMLTGHAPYKGRGTKEILDQVVAGPPPPISSLNPAADRGLTIIAEKAMARELRNRYADMRDVSSDLQLVKQGKRPAGGSQIKQSWGASQWAMTAVVLVCIAGIALLGWTFWRERKSTNSVPPTTPTTVTTPATPTTLRTVPALSPAPTSSITVFAGTAGVAGSADGVGAEAQFRLPNGIAVDKAGDVYVADTGNNTIRRISQNGMVTTLAGKAGSHGNSDGTGAGARFWAPFGVAVDGSGNIYVADTVNNTIRRITADGGVTTVAGMAGRPGSEDGVGAAARFRNPWGIAVDSSGNVYVADSSNDTIRKITPAGVVTTFAGEAGSPGLHNATDRTRFNNPFAVAVGPSSSIVYVADSGNNLINLVISGNSVFPVSDGTEKATPADAIQPSPHFLNPQGLAVDAKRNVYVADTGNGTLRRISAEGTVTTLLDAGGGKVTFDKGNKIVKFTNPGGVAVDSAGNIYVADTGANCVRKITSPK